MSETLVPPQLSPKPTTLTLTADSGSHVEPEKEAKRTAKNLAHLLLAAKLRGHAAAKHKITLSMEACVDIINENEQAIQEADEKQLDNLFDQLLETPKAKMTIIPDGAQPPGVEAAVIAAGEALAANQGPAAIDGAIEATKEALSQDNKDNQDNNDFLILPLRTSRNTLIEFAKYYAEKNKFQKDDNIFKKLNMASAIGDGPEWNIFSSNDYIIRNMDFNLYWEMRNFQITRMQEELQELLGLALDEQGNPRPKEGLAAFLHKADQFIRDPLAKTLSPEEKVKYVEKMLAFLDGVSIEPAPDLKPGEKKVILKKKYADSDVPLDLVTITEDTSGDKNNMEFSINPELFKYPSPDGQKRLADAIELSIDQATRLLERNQDKKYRLEISGYEDSPEMVLRMFYSAKLHGHNATIDKDTTLKFWEKQAQEGTTPEERTRYQHALDLYNKLNNPNMKLKDLRQHEAEVLAQKLGRPGATQPGKASSNAKTTPISITKL